MIRMSFLRRRSRKFEPVSPQTRYTVTYLGRQEMSGKVALDNVLKPVDDLYKQFKLKKVKSSNRLQIEIVNNGIRVEPTDSDITTMFPNSPYYIAEGPNGNIFFPINKLSFGAADPFHTKVFCFVSRNENPARDSHWDCHAVLCESTAMAKNLTLYLVKAFQRIAESKDDPIAAARRTKKITTVHILRERGTLEHQLSKKKSKRPPVSTVKVTLNIEGTPEQINTAKQLNDNKKIADIMAKQKSTDFRDLYEATVVSDCDESKDNGNVTPQGVGTSDKENELMDDMADDVDGIAERAQEVMVTIAVNPDLSSPPESPRKSPSPRGAARSENVIDVEIVEDIDVAVDGNTSPQAMITTMSPPDTPGYLTSEANPISIAPLNAPTELHLQKGRDSEREVEIEKTTASPTSPQIPDPAALISPDTEDLANSVMTRKNSPSPYNFPSPSSSKQLPASPAADATTEVKSNEKKLKREKGKSVRFADDPELIG